MKKLRRLLAVILTATMLLGNTGITYAAEAAADSTAQAEQEDERSDAGAGQQAAAEVEDSSDNEADSAEPSEEESVAAATAGSAVSTVAAAMADTAESAATAEDSEEEQEAADESGTAAEEAASADTEVPASEDPAEAETADTAKTAEPAEEEKFTAGELTYHGNGYTVSMSYDADAMIPADAKLKVREIKEGTAEYDSYLKGAEAASDKGVAQARFFDITIWAKDKEIQPKSAVRVNISYNNAIEVADEGEVTAMHFEDGSGNAEVLDTDTNGGSEVSEVAFDANSFSVYGIVYTVDFTYDGYTFSMPGEGSILLSELAQELGLYEKDYDKAFSVSNVSDVTFTDYDLLKIEKQADGDWLLISLAPFSSEEILTVTMEDGVKFVIGVTDEQVSSNLVDFLTNAVITGATQDSEGRYEVEAGTEYNIILSFAESSAHQFDNRATLTYTMPDGLTILSRQTGDLKVNIVYKGRTYQVDATYDLGTDGNLEIKFDENDPDFHHLENSTNVSFRFSYNGAFDGSEENIHFSEDIERDIVFEEPEPGQAYVTKNGTFDEQTGKFTYTITVEATGDITNVNVKDVISGNALIFNNDVRVSGNSSSYRDNGATNGFDYTFASMAEGEVITITYSASVDFSKDDNKDGKITVDQTKNTATVKPDGGDPHSSEYSHEIAFKTTNKSNGTPDGTTADGDKIYKWTITYNELRLASAGGDTIKDTIAAASTEYMKYYGDGLSINVIDKNGNIVDTRNVPYSSLQSYSDSSWTYKIPEGDSQPYMYEITYYTVVDMEKVEGTGNTVTVTNDANGTSGSADVTPESVISVTKSVDSFTTEKVNWSVTLGVPENGLTQAVVTDTFPSIWLGGRNIYDLLEDGSLQITGLLDGESYTVENVGQGQVKITFFQDPGKRISGLKAAPGGHTITIKLTTDVDQEWLQAGYEMGGYVQTHTNSVDFNGKTATASVVFGKPGIEKKGEALTDSQGNVTGLKYTVRLVGVSETPVSVLDTFDTSVLEVDTSKASSWDHMRIWGGNQWSQDAGRMPVSYTDTGDGIILTADSVPMQADGTYYPYYRIVYYLKVKDGVDLNALAIANGGEYDVDNTVKWGDHESEFTYKVEYDYLDKQLLNEGELGGTSRTAKYQITFNPSKATLNEGSDMTMTDVLSANLSVDYSSINIVTDPAGQSVIYSLSGRDDGATIATYTIPDSTKVTITYDANVRGNGSQTIVNKVSVNGKDETVENTKSYGSASEGEGAQASFKIVKVDGYDANKKLQGVKFKVFCENPDVDFGGGQKELILVTDENGEITFDGDAYTFYFDEVYHVQEVEAPEDYGTISFDYLVTLTNDMQKVDYGHYIYYYSDSMQIKNWPLEGLVVEKQVESSDQADYEAYYDFRISVLNDDGSVNTDFNEKSGDDQFVNGVAEFRLKAGEQKMFWGFEKGTKYKVEEVDAEGFVTTVKYSVYDEDGNVKEVKTETTTEHTKTDFGSLKIKKNVTVNGEATTGTSADGEYTFVVKDSEGNVVSTQIITITNGVSNEVVVEDLVPGTYTVSEVTDSIPEGMELVTDNDQEIEVTAGETAEVETAEFTNNKVEVGSLKIKKNVTVKGEETTGKEADGVYTFEVKDAEGNVVSTQTITITNGASNEVVVGDLLPGTYTVSELTDSNPQGIALATDNDIEIEVTAGETAEVPTAEFTNNKPDTPEFEKKIQDINDSTGETSDWQDSADYDIGDEIPFKLTATLAEDVTDYSSYSIMFEDTMEDTLTFSGVSKVLLGTTDITADCDISPASGGQSFTVSIGWGEKYGTEITEALNGATVEVYFTAKLNENAKLGNAGNANAARLHYSNNPNNVDESDKTPWDYVIAFTYKLDLNKVDQDGEALTGAEFKLEKKLADGTTKEIELSIEDNVFTGKGLDDGEYVLTETKTPEGYKQIDPITFTVSATHGAEWDYTSADLDFNIEGRSEVLESLTGETESGELTFTTLDNLEGLEGTLTNRETGSLKIKKNVTVDGQPTTGTSADGEYTFVVKDSTGKVVSTQTITITNGVSGEAEVKGLLPGTYTVSEETGGNPSGMQLVTDNDLEVIVTAGETAEIPTAEFTNNKPGTPTFEKKIRDTNDSTGDTSGWQDSADYDIGDEIPYKLTATLANDVSTYGSYSIVFEDEMEDTLTFKGVSKVILTKNDGSTQDITWDSVFQPTSGGQRFTVSTGWGRNYSAERMPISELLNGATVDVYFTAQLNENAKLGNAGNVNAARLRYSNNPTYAADFEYTPWDYVIAFTYKLDVNKVDQDGEALEGAAFKLEKKLADGTTQEISLSRTGSVFTGKGLDDGEYVLTETTTPVGYKPIDPITFTVTAEHGITWDYTSADLNFNGEGRSGVLTALTGSTTSGDLEFTTLDRLEGLEGTLTNEGIGAIKIEKTVTGTTATDKEFTFEIALTAPTGTTLDSSYPATLDGEKTDDAAVTDGKVTVTLTAGQVYEITGLPAGTTYTVTETELPDGYIEGSHTGTEGTIEVGKAAQVTMNNTYETAGEVTFNGTKTLEGRDLKKDEFTFELYESGKETPIQTVTNNADGSYAFETIEYSGEDLDTDQETGAFAETVKTYTIKEKAGTDTSITYDDTEYEITVTLNDNGDGTITAVKNPDPEGGYAFTNEYDAKGEVTFGGAKTMEGQKLEAGAYTFELYERGNTDPIQTVTNDAKGDFSFETIPYTLADLNKDADGKYIPTNKYYTVKEVEGDSAGVTYDKTVYDITVTISDDGSGNLSVETDKTPGACNFKNTYNTKGEITFSGKKTLENKALEEGMFTFELYDSEGTLIEDVTNAADGSYSFTKIGYTGSDLDTDDDGNYVETTKTYKVVEKAEGKAGITYDDTEYEITVTLKDDGEGTIEVSADPKENTYDFTNTYETKGDITFSGTKTLKNRALEEGEFSFELYDSEGELIETVTNAADGSYSFTAIGYTGSDLDKDADGNYVETTKTYKVVEKTGDDSSVTYDTTEYEITVTLKDDGEGTIETSATPDAGSYDFTNTYKTKGEITFSGKKTLENKTLEEGMFTFELYDSEGTLIEEVTNAADGSYSFTKIGYTGSDLDTDDDGNYVETTKTYKVVEKAGEAAGIEYDDKEYEITVTLTDDGEGTIKAVADPKENTYDFTNTYETKGKTVIGGVKVLEGRELKDGEFTFELKDENGDVVKTAANDADGNFSFEELTFTGEDLDTDADGNYIETTKTYTVAEKAGSDTTITYDGSEYTVELTLTDDGNGNIEVVKNPEDAAAQTFTNKYEAKGEVTFGGKKTLEGRALTEGEFSFELKDAEGNVLEKVTNDADGNYSFTTIKYTLADLDKDGGKYIPTEKVYTVSEVSGEDENVEYDDKVYTITCILTDKGDNTIEVTTDEVPGACDFTNTYNTKGEITFSGKKTLENRALFAGEFTFELYDSEGTQIDLVFNEDDGSYSFSKIEYTGEDLDKDDDGNFIETTKTYKVVEKAGEESSVTYDNTEYEITVTLKDNGEGTIETSADPKEDTYDFTNTYETEGEITLSGEKTLENRKLTEGEFSFELYDEDGTLLETVTNAADGSYSFTTIKYTGDDLDKDSAGNYLETIKNYRVVEKAGEDGSVTYDDTEYEITVTLTDNGKGTIEVTADPAEDSYDFTNTYSTKGEITFSGEKTLENRALTEGEFSFELYDSEGTLLETTTNKADGSYSFTKIEYTGDDLDKDADGYYVETTKTYKVVEKAGEDSSVTYDETEYEITVTLTDDGEGTIEVTADPAEDSYDFTNTYSAKGDVVIEAEKILKGRPLEFGQFSFELYDSEGSLIQTAECDNDGSVVFDAIEYTQDDMDKETSGDLKDTVKTYTLKEATKDDKGYTYSEAVYTINVTLHDDKAGTIETSADKDKFDLTFTNIYEAEGEIVLHARKTLLGERALEEGQFTFVLKDENGNVIDSKTNAADGSVTFDALKYTQDDVYDVDPETGVYSGAGTKTYTYTISEVIPEGAKDNGDGTFFFNGYTYDGTVYTVDVVLTDNGDGTITAVDAAGETDYTFTNAYDAKGILKMDAEKTFKNGTLKGGEFTFELKDADGNVLQSKKNDAAGNVSFDMIDYTMADVANSPFTYTVNEVAGDKDDIKFDETVYTVTVTLEDNGDGTLKVTKSIDNGGVLKFVNEQLNVETSITIGGVKVLKGQNLKDGQFKFVMVDENGKKIDEARNDADGDFTFGSITYKLSDLGGETKKVFTYDIYEVEGTDRRIIYDKKVHKVVVTVTDNGDGTMTAKADKSGADIKFVNTTRDKTGDEAPLGVLFGGLGLGAAGLVVLLEERRRRNRRQ